MDTPAKKSLGQHWLHDQATLQSIAQAASISDGDTVLEIGPGTGELSEVLLAVGAKLLALEIDDDLLVGLRDRFEGDANFTLDSGDIRSFDLNKLPIGYKIVANIPYYLTSHLVRIISESANPPQTAVLLIQKEVAQRLAANPGDLSILGITAQYYWEVSLGIDVPSNLFTPPPKVDSKVVILQRRTKPLFTNVDHKQFFQLVKAGFSAKRKTLLNALSGGLRLAKEDTKMLLEQAGINPAARAQSLSLQDWHELYTAHYS